MMWPSETLKDALIYMGYPDLADTDEARRLGDLADNAVRTGPLNCSPKVAMAATYYLLQDKLWANKEQKTRVARAFDCSVPPLLRAIRLLEPYLKNMEKRGWKP